MHKEQLAKQSWAGRADSGNGGTWSQSRGNRGLPKAGSACSISSIKSIWANRRKEVPGWACLARASSITFSKFMKFIQSSDLFLLGSSLAALDNYFKFSLVIKYSFSVMLIQSFYLRSRGGHARTNSQGSASSEQIVAPSKSSEDMKLKPSSKKKLKPASRERDREHYQKNYFRACENLLSVTVDKKRTAATVILSLKKSGPEITQLLSQCAAGIAGTGLAILLSVAFKSGNGRAPVPLTTTKLFNAGLGIGFFYLSWSVNCLRDAVAAVRRSTKKLKLTEEEMVAMVNGSITAVLYRAAALAAVALLRFA